MVKSEQVTQAFRISALPAFIRLHGNDFYSLGSFLKISSGFLSPMVFALRFFQKFLKKILNRFRGFSQDFLQIFSLDSFRNSSRIAFKNKSMFSFAVYKETHEGISTGILAQILKKMSYEFSPNFLKKFLRSFIQELVHL